MNKTVRADKMLAHSMEQITPGARAGVRRLYKSMRKLGMERHTAKLYAGMAAFGAESVTKGYWR